MPCRPISGQQSTVAGRHRQCRWLNSRRSTVAAQPSRTTAASSAARDEAKTSSSIISLPSGPASGTRQFGYSSMVPGWFCVRRSPDQVGQRHRDQLGRRPGQIPVQRQHGRLHLGVRRVRGVGVERRLRGRGQPPGPARRAGAARPARRCARRRRRPVPRPASGSADRAGPAAGRGRRPDSRRSAAGRAWSPRPGSTRATIPGRSGAPEPWNSNSNHRIDVPRMPRSARYSRTQGSTVPRSSPTTTAPRADRLQRQDADQRLVVVPQVGALGRPVPLRDPPQPEQPDDVVHPHAAGRPQHRRHHVPERRVGPLGQPVRPPRRLLPVLAVLVVRVRRRADGHALREDVLQAPGVGALRCTPTARSCMTPERHAGPDRGGLRGGQLLVDHPLQPAVEVDDDRHCAARNCDNRRRMRVAAAPPARRASPGRALGQRAPGRVVARRPSPSRAPVGLVGDLATGADRGTACTSCSAVRFAVQAASRSIRSRSRRAPPAPARAAPPPRRARRRPGRRTRGSAPPAGRAGSGSGGWSAGTATAPSAAPARPRAADSPGRSRRRARPRAQTARSSRSTTSPTPHDRADRTLYSWVATPQARAPPIRSGRPTQVGVTISGRLGVLALGPGTQRVVARAAGHRAARKLASPIVRPSRYRGGYQFST